jgi:hypothetical protein
MRCWVVNSIDCESSKKPNNTQTLHYCLPALPGVLTHVPDMQRSIVHTFDCCCAIRLGKAGKEMKPEVGNKEKKGEM